MAILLALPVGARAQSLSGANAYPHCLALVKENPGRALAEAKAWENADGAAAAVHCEALALVALHRYGDAGRALDGLAHDPNIPDAAERAELFDQAGNAYMLANRSSEAETSFAAALALDGNNIDVLADRARARAQRADWAGAEADLTAALAKDPNRMDLLVLRASARHAEGKKKGAEADIAAALALYPDYPEALVQRGEMRYEDGDMKGARADWQKVVASAPGTAAANAAKQHLILMSQKARPQAPLVIH